MLPSASALASRREERVQKALSVDHHGPGDARLSHRATAIYGEHSDYVLPLRLVVFSAWCGQQVLPERPSCPADYTWVARTSVFISLSLL